MSKFLQQKPLILASASVIRNKLLRSLGLEFTVIPANCDEGMIKQRFQTSNWLEMAFLLASTKALLVSQSFPDHFIIAADQLCVLGNNYFDKPLNHATAVKHLQQLSGKTHQQIATTCIAKAGNIIWQHHDQANLTLRELSIDTINTYLQLTKPYQSCGAYQFEGEAKWLFKEVEGQESTILGLPLLPLSQALLDLKIVSL